MELKAGTETTSDGTLCCLDMVQVNAEVKKGDSGSCSRGVGWKGMGEEGRGQRKREGVQWEQRRNEALALKETEADLRAAWH